jgi:hypothetical protein
MMLYQNYRCWCTVKADRALEGIESLLEAMDYDAALSAMEQARALYTQVLAAVVVYRLFDYQCKWVQLKRLSA